MFQLTKTFMFRNPYQLGGNLCKSLQFSPNFTYIKKKDLDDIEKAHGVTMMEKIKMYSKQGTHIYMEGYKSFRKDIAGFIELKKKEWKENRELTKEQIALKNRMRQELHRMKAMVVIQILPMSGPLLIYYLYTYPTSIPTWFCIDSLHEGYQIECIKKQKDAIQHFKKHPLMMQNLKLRSMKLSELKKLSELLCGHFQDGIFGYNKIMKKDINYLVHPYLSKLLLIRNMKNEFREDIVQHEELKKLSLEEKIAWKYKKVMNNQNLLTFQKIQHEDSENTETATLANAVKKPQAEESQHQGHSRKKHLPKHK